MKSRIVKIFIKLLFFLLSSMLILAVFFFSWLSDSMLQPARSTIPSRSITENSLGLQEIWRVSSLAGTGDRLRFSFAVMTLTSPYIVAEDIGLPMLPKLVAIDTATGVQQWATTLNQGISGIRTIAADTDRVYVAGEVVQAYWLQTGELAWSGAELPPRRLYFLDIQDGILFNHTGDFVQAIDPGTGVVLEEDQEIDQSAAYLVRRSAEFDLWKLFKLPDETLPAELVKVRRNPAGLVWRTPIEDEDGYPLRFPILSEDKLFVPFAASFQMRLYVFDFATGKRLWKTDHTFVSNAAIAQGKVYLLRDDARLIVFDAASGTELGYAQFNPAETHAGSEAYWVGADKQGRVFVYFSDSRELFGLAAK